MSLGCFIADFGRNGREQIFRVNGSKNDIEDIITELDNEEGHTFKTPPVIENIHKNYTTLITIVYEDKQKGTR